MRACCTDRLIIALLEIRKESAVKSTNFSALRAEAPLHGKPSLLETPSVNSCLRPCINTLNTLNLAMNGGAQCAAKQARLKAILS